MTTGDAATRGATDASRATQDAVALRTRFPALFPGVQPMSEKQSRLRFVIYRVSGSGVCIVTVDVVRVVVCGEWVALWGLACYIVPCCPSDVQKNRVVAALSCNEWLLREE